MAKKLVNLRLEEDFIQLIRDFANENQITMSALIKISLIEYIKSHK